MNKIFALILLVVGGSAMAMATVSAPEIDPASGSSALALFAGAVMLVRGRRKKQSPSL